MFFKKYLASRRLEKRIRKLSEAERQVILTESPFEFGWFQGEGFHIFLKSEPDFSKAFVDSVGETYQRVAEDWIIRKYLLEHDKPK